MNLNYISSKSLEIKFLSSFLFILSIFFNLYCQDEVFAPAFLKYYQIGLSFLAFSVLFWKTDSKMQGGFLLLVILGLGLRLLHLPETIPFYAFSFPVNQYVFGSFLSVLAFYIGTEGFDQKWIDKMVFWLPLAFLVLINAYYNILDFKSMDPEDARHISNALTIYNHLVSGESEKFFEAITYYDFYFPVSYLSAFPFFLIFGKSFSAGTLSLSMLWLPIAYLFLWKIQTRFLKISPWISSLTCLFIFSNGLSSTMMKMYMQDMPVMAMNLAFIYYFLKSDFFNLRKESVLCGLIFGLALITKANLLISSLAPVLLSLFYGIRQKTIFTKLSNQLFFFFSTTLVASIWFSVTVYYFSYDLKLWNQTWGDRFPEVFSLESLFFYPLAIFKTLGFFHSIFIVYSIYYLIYYKKIEKDFVFIIVYLVLFFSVVTLVRVKDPRTIFPSLFFLYLLISRNLSLVKQGVQYVVSLLIIFYVVEESSFFVSGKSIFIDKNLLSSPFVISGGLGPATVEDQNKSRFIFDKLCNNQNIRKENFPINWNSNYSPFIQRFYDQAWTKSGNPNPVHVPNAETLVPIFCRDKFWPDYYLFASQKTDSTLSFYYLDDKANVKGNLNLKFIFKRADNSTIRDTTIGFSDYGQIFTLRKNPEVAKVEMVFFVHQAFPSGQRVRAYYQLVGREKYDPFFIPLEMYKPDGTRQASTEISF